MTAQNQRDPDGTDILGQVRDGLADLKANVISRWGRVPHVAADPTTLNDGMVWVRSDNGMTKWRANGVTYPTTWTALTPAGAWTNLGGGFQTAQSRLNGDVVEVRGVVQGGAAPSTITTLPAGSRPPAALIFATSSNTLFGEIRIATTGVITLQAGNLAYVVIDCRFSVST